LGIHRQISLDQWIIQNALVSTDVQSRYVTAFELNPPSAKNAVDKIIIHSSYLGLPRYISFDCRTHFTSELTKVCLERHWRATGIVERSHSTVKLVLSKLAAGNPW
jgi:hypothetical protein